MGGGLDCVDVGDTGLCITPHDVPHSPINCTDTSGADYVYCEGSTQYSKDYWAGAKKACQELGGRLMTEAEAKNLIEYVKVDDSLDKLEESGFSWRPYCWFWYDSTKTRNGDDEAATIFIDPSEGVRRYDMSYSRTSQGARTARCVE